MRQQNRGGFMPVGTTLDGGFGLRLRRPPRALPYQCRDERRTWRLTGGVTTDRSKLRA
jgi:hypothetical protein